MRHFFTGIVVFLLAYTHMQAQCDLQAPTVTNITVCEQMQFTGVFEAQASVQVESWKWFDQSHNLIHTSATPTYSPSVSTAIATTEVFYVSYTALNQAQELCESPQTEALVTITPTLNCPCITPTNVFITSTDADTTLCLGQSLTIATNAQANTTDFDFTIYKESVNAANIVAGPTANISSITHTISFADAGSYIVLVRDKMVPQQTACYKSDTIVVKTAPNPTAIITGGGTYCEDSPVTPVTISITGTFPFTYTYQPGAIMRSNQTNSSYSPPAITAPGTYTYKLTSLQDRYCTAAAADINSSSSIIINPIPPAPVASDVAYCVNAIASPLTATALSGAILTWYSTATGGMGSVTAPTPPTMVAGTWNYWVSQTVNGCESARTQITVTINNFVSPSISAIPSFSECAGTAINLLVSTNQYPTITWSGMGAMYLNSTVIATPTFSPSAPAGVYTLTATVTDVNGCSGSATQTITIQPIPATPTVTTTPICAGATLNVSTATVTGATYTWTTPDGFNPGNVASFSRSNANTFMAGNYSVIVMVNGCSSLQGSTTATIYPNPTVALTPSRIDACKSGNNSSPITVNISGTGVGGTSVFTSVPTGVNTTNGSLDPTIVPTGNYIIELQYTDINGCIGTATTTVFVRDIPTVTIQAPTTMCSYDAPITIIGNPVAVTPATGIFSGAITTNSFNPAIATIGTHQITYTYRDWYGCENSASTAITVVNIAPPTVTSGNPKSVISQVDDTFLPGENTDLRVTGAHTIEWMDATCSTVTATGEIFATGLTPIDVGSFTYKVRQRDPATGCMSVCVDASIDISKCPAYTPIAIDSYFCVGEASPLTVTAVANGPLAAGDKLVWFATSNTAGAPILDNNATYSEAISTAAPTTKTVYVAQYNAINTCFSQAKAVTINVVANPTVTLTAPANVCAVAGLVNITTTPAGGTLTGIGATGLNAAARTWDPMDGETPNPSKTLNLSYVVTETHPDGKVCSTTKTASTTAHFMAPPVPEDKTWLISDIANIPNNFMTASPSGTGVSIQWYNDQAMTSPRVQAPFVTATNNADKIALQTEVGSTISYMKSYWITQTDAFGCKSEPTEVTLLLTNCPFIAPTTIGAEVCVGETMSPISAAKPTNMVESVDGWRWYTSSSATTPIFTGGSMFMHGVSNQTAGTTTFYVSYVATDPITGQQCESPRTPVTVRVNPLPQITMNVPAVVCHDAGDILLQVAVNTYSNGIGSGIWSVNGGQNGISQGGVFNPAFMGEVTGNYTIGYSYTDGKGCNVTTTKDLLVQYTPAPSTIDHFSMVIANPTVKVEATNLEPGAVVQWYDANNNKLTIPTATEPIFFTGDLSSVVINKIYRVTQAVFGCESNKANATVLIIDCQVPAPNVAPISPICSYDAMPEITATVGSPWGEGGVRPSPSIPVEFRFYNSAKSNLPIAVNTTGVYTPTIDRTNVEEFTIYVAEYNANVIPVGCEGPRTAVTIKIFTPTKPLDQSFSFYYNQQNTVTIPDYDSLCEYKWYEFEPTLGMSPNHIGKSYTFTSDITPKTLYVTQSKHSCESAPATYTLCGITKPVVSLESIEITTAEELPTLTSLAPLLPNEQLVWIESDKEFISQSYTPKHSFPGTYSIQVYTTNTATSCTSPPISIPVTILPCGDKPTPTSDTIVKILHNQPAPSFQTAETNVVWFDARHNQIAEGNSYTPQNLRPGTYVFYAHTVNENCKSASQSFTVTVDGYHISGTVFFDRNEDGIQQTEDNPVAGQLLYIEEADMYISTQANGKFTWNTPEYGTYTIRLVNKLATNQLLSDIAVPVTIDQEHLSVNTITFRYKVNTAHNIGIYISNGTSPVVGRDFTVYCYNRNFGSTQYNVLTTITYDNTKCTLKSTSKPYHTHIGNEIEFIDDAINGYSYSYITLTFTVLPNPNLTNQIIAMYSTIESALVDAVPQNNIDSLKLTILNSQDPNDKAVTPSYKENGYVLMNSKLEYKIRFQNKGTAEAWDIYIRDTIDEHLDLSTFNVLASSHDMYYTMQGRVITFYFDSIMLPAEMYDEPGSNGFIDYEISPLPNVPEETQVFNTAHIFFDFNPAVVTNTTTSTYVVALPKEEELPDDITVVQREISLVPNPVETQTTITIDARGTKYLIVQNATGATVFETTFEGNTYVLDCRTMQPGLYVCSVVCNGKVYTEKCIKK